MDERGSLCPALGKALPREGVAEWGLKGASLQVLQPLLVMGAWDVQGHLRL